MCAEEARRWSTFTSGDWVKTREKTRIDTEGQLHDLGRSKEIVVICKHFCLSNEALVDAVIPSLDSEDVGFIGSSSEQMGIGFLCGAIC